MTNDFGVPLEIDTGVVSFGESIRALSFAKGLALSSNSTIALKIDARRHANDELRTAGPIAFSGSLTVSNVSGALKEGDAFRLFASSGYSGVFEHFRLPELPSNLKWNTQTLTNGILSITSSKP